MSFDGYPELKSSFYPHETWNEKYAILSLLFVKRPTTLTDLNVTYYVSQNVAARILPYKWNFRVVWNHKGSVVDMARQCTWEGVRGGSMSCCCLNTYMSTLTYILYWITITVANIKCSQTTKNEGNTFVRTTDPLSHLHACAQFDLSGLLKRYQRFTQLECDPRICCTKLGSDVCATHS